MALGKDYRIKYPLNEQDALFIDGIYRGRYPAEAGLLPLGEPVLEDAQSAVKIAETMLAFCSKTRRPRKPHKQNLPHHS